MESYISVVVPVHDEEDNVLHIHEDLVRVFDRLPYEFELIYVNDGSTDRSVDAIESVSLNDHRVHLVDLSRNFGKEIALTAGLRRATGVAVIMIDADGQHPPEVIPDLVQAWEQGAEVVVGVRTRGQSRRKRISSWSYYKVLNKIAAAPVTPGSTDYRLLDRIVVDAYNTFTERNRVARGLVDWLGFRRAYVEFTANERVAGSPSYGLRKLLRLALDSFVSSSFFPLRVAGYLGGVITCLAAVFGMFMLTDKWVLDDPLNLGFSGTALLAMILVFLVGIILSCLGLIALYIANIHTEVVNRPLYVERVRTPHGKPPGVLDRAGVQQRECGRTGDAQRGGPDVL